MEILSTDKDTLQADLDDAPDLTKSGFYKLVYSNEYGVLGGKPLFVCKYLMAKKHWQIVKHRAGGDPLEGGHLTVPLGEAPLTKRATSAATMRVRMTANRYGSGIRRST